MAKTKNPESDKRPAKEAPASTSGTSGTGGVAGSPPSKLSLLMSWILSRSVRHATAMRKHVQKLLNHQRDILSPQAIEAMQTGIAQLRSAVERKVDQAGLEQQMERLEQTANKWLKPYPNAAWRENIEVLLVALAVAMGIRTFFLQPFKIPTGSMQPTLYGVTSDNLLNKPEYKIPTGWQRVREWFAGTS